MLSFFKSTKKVPKKGKSFYDRENLIQTVKELINVLDHLDSPNSSKTNSNILFQGLELDTIVEKNLKKEFGDELYCLEPNSGIPNHRIYYYRVPYNDLKLLIQLHFYKDKFFFSATKVYSDALLTHTDKQKVLKQIISKYHPEMNEKSFDLDITDQKGNILFTQDNVFYYLKYLVNNSTSQMLKLECVGNLILKPEKKNTEDKLI